MAGDDQSPAPDDASSPSSTAQDRLAQVSSHIAPNTPKRRRRKGGDADLPADYSDILGQITTLRNIAATPDTSNRGYVTTTSSSVAAKTRANNYAHQLCPAKAGRQTVGARAGGAIARPGKLPGGRERKRHGQVEAIGTRERRAARVRALEQRTG